MEFMGRLAALVPKPRVNLTRFHGVFSPNSRLREYVAPTKPAGDAEAENQPRNKAYSMTWEQRLKRVFNIDIETCRECGGAVKVIACIETPVVIKQILDHLKHKAETSESRALPESRAPPAGLHQGLFD